MPTNADRVQKENVKLYVKVGSNHIELLGTKSVDLDRRSVIEEDEFVGDEKIYRLVRALDFGVSVSGQTVDADTAYAALETAYEGKTTAIVCLEVDWPTSTDSFQGGTVLVSNLKTSVKDSGMLEYSFDLQSSGADSWADITKVTGS